MNNTTPKEKFLNALLSSKIFQSMNEKKREELLKAYENAPDEAYEKALKELENEEKRLSEQEIQKTQIEESKAIERDVKDLKKVLLKDNEKKDKIDTEKQANALLNKLGDVTDTAKSEKKAKRKKLFGIF